MMSAVMVAQGVVLAGNWNRFSATSPAHMKAISKNIMVKSFGCALTGFAQGAAKRALVICQLQKHVGVARGIKGTPTREVFAANRVKPVRAFVEVLAAILLEHR
jgi:hypothetical protein